MGVFRYACRNDGYLFLGASEVADSELFRDVDKKHRIFRARIAEGVKRAIPDLLTSHEVPSRPTGLGRPDIRTPAAEIHAAALEDASAPSVLVDEQGNVLHVSASAGRFLQQSGGPLARKATELVRPELRDELSVLLHRAFETTEPQLSPFVPVAFDTSHRRVALLAQQRPPRDDARRPYVLVTLLDAGAVADAPEPSPGDGRPTESLIRDLRQQLREAEHRIEAMRDDHYLANEDLRAANEELQSLNEEYRSTSEELETSKEELQSLNEELHTVNQELKIKLEEVSRAHSDLENLMAATDVPTLFLDEDLRIKRFTPQLGEIFNV